MSEKVPVLSFEQIFMNACKLPYCKINRDKFLTTELKGRVSADQLADALKNGTVSAKIPITILNDIADSSITLETSKVTLIATAAGLPGGLAMGVTVPADLAQFYAHVIRIAQKLAYIYGAEEIEFRDGAQSVLMVYLGTMFGVQVANAALVKFAADNAVKIGNRVAVKPLTKFAWYRIFKKIAAQLTVNVTKKTVGNAISKSVFILGGLISGGLTVSTFLPMANRLKKELAHYAVMSPDDLVKSAEDAEVILEQFVNTSDDAPALLEANEC